MDSKAFQIGPISIYWYSIMIVLGIIVAFFVANHEIKRLRLNKEFFINLTFYTILFGILGARIYYVLFNLDYYLTYPTEIIKIWHGGLAIHGGIFAGVCVIIYHCKKYKMSILKVLDICAVSLIIAQAIGRWGNFFNQEAYGFLTSKANLESLMLPNFIIDGMYINGSYYHPTFFYESLWNTLGFIIMIFLRRRKNNKIGQITGFYMIWYSIGRIAIEQMRMDSLMLGPIKVAQLVSLVFVIVGIIIMVKKTKKDSKNNLYNVDGEK